MIPPKCKRAFRIGVGGLLCVLLPILVCCGLGMDAHYDAGTLVREGLLSGDTCHFRAGIYGNVSS
jgi:hypothetical protein